MDHFCLMTRVKDEACFCSVAVSESSVIAAHNMKLYKHGSVWSS